MSKGLAAIAGIILGTTSCQYKPCPTEQPIQRVEEPVPINRSYDNDSSHLTDENIEAMLASTEHVGTKATYFYAKGREKEEEITGSMLHIGTFDGCALYLTAYHVINPPDQYGNAFTGYGNKTKQHSYIRTGDGTETAFNELEVVVQNEFLDLSLVKAKEREAPVTTTPYPYFADENKIAQGDIVYSVGFPHNLGKHLTRGIIQAKGTTQEAIDQYSDGFKNVTWVNANLLPGHSGGPLFVLENGTPKVCGISRLYVNGGGIIYAATNIETIKKFMQVNGHAYLLQ